MECFIKQVQEHVYKKKPQMKGTVFVSACVRLAKIKKHRNQITGKSMVHYI